MLRGADLADKPIPRPSQFMHGLSTQAHLRWLHNPPRTLRTSFLTSRAGRARRVVPPLAVLDYIIMSKPRCTIESLEGRTLMAASHAVEPLLYVHNQILYLEGTKGAEHITIGLNADLHRIDLTVNGVTTSFDPEFLSGVVLDGKGGKDHIEVLDNHGPLPASVTLVGGSGKDALVATEPHVAVQGRLRDMLA